MTLPSTWDQDQHLIACSLGVNFQRRLTFRQLFGLHLQALLESSNLSRVSLDVVPIGIPSFPLLHNAEVGMTQKNH